MDWTKQLIRFGVMMVLQVLLVDQVQLYGVCHPYIYVICLLMMPVTLSPKIDMLCGFVAGLLMDVFCNSLGVHMAACTLVMFSRRYILELIVNDVDRLNEQISWRSLGAEAMIKYTVILVLVHHFTVFMLSAWSWNHFGYVLVETAISGAMTIIFVLGYNIVKYR